MYPQTKMSLFLIKKDVSILQSSNLKEVVAALDPKWPGNPKSLIFYVYVMKWMTSPKKPRTDSIQAQAANGE